MKPLRLTSLNIALALTAALAASLLFGGQSTVESQDPVESSDRCPPGFTWDRMSGVGCVQTDCYSIGYLDYTGHCVCPEGKKGCFKEVDYDTYDVNLCFPNCPNSILISCIENDATCPAIAESGTASGNSAPAGAAAEEPSRDEVQGENEAGSGAKTPSRADLLADLQSLLAGEGIKSPTPGQIAAGGIALSTLLLTWVLLNRASGISAETSLDVIKEWRQGQVPPGAPVDTPTTNHVPGPPPVPAIPGTSPGSAGASASATIGYSITDTITTDQSPATEQDTMRSVSPSEEGMEERALRGIEDAQDLDDAYKKTIKDFDAFEENIPENIRESEAWKNHVKPKIEKIKELLKKGELDQARTWMDRAAELIKLRNEVDQDLGYLPNDQREAILWTERTLRTLGHFATDAYQRLVTDPAKAAGSAILPSECAKRWNDSMDELNKGLSGIAPNVTEAVRKGARNLTHGKDMERAREWTQSTDYGVREQGQEILELHEERQVPVETPDFWGRGMKKLKQIKDTWNNTGGRLSSWLRIK